MSWNRSNGAQKPEPRKPSAMRGIIAGGMIVLAACAAFFFLFSGGDDAPKAKPEKERGRIKEVMLAKAPTNAVATVPEKPVRRTKKGTIIPDRVQPDEDGVLRWPGGLRWVDTNNVSRMTYPAEKKLFKCRSDEQIATMLKLDPTRMAPFLIGKRRPYGDRFIKDFNDSLSVKVEFDKDDTPEEHELKQMVIDTKKELYEAMNRGENIADIMNQAQKDLDSLAACHDELRREIKKAQNDETVSDADVEILVEAANKMLAERGIKKFAMPNLSKRQMRLALQREIRQKKAEKAIQNGGEAK